MTLEARRHPTSIGLALALMIAALLITGAVVGAIHGAVLVGMIAATARG